jgi:hypothetical protein
MGLVISAFANTRDQATTIVPLQLIFTEVRVPKLPDLATVAAKIAVSGYWLTEAMRSVFITAEGRVRIMNAHTGTLMDMTVEPATYGASIVAAHALAFLPIWKR